ncbi:MAG: hypothetical protein HY551_05715 [Elusimicrobia bacterium]|nr:hypothetical protein [Elusimicrobiota bacterium]
MYLRTVPAGQWVAKGGPAGLIQGSAMGMATYRELLRVLEARLDGSVARAVVRGRHGRFLGATRRSCLLP